jgi:hypothetical protein
MDNLYATYFLDTIIFYFKWISMLKTMMDKELCLLSDGTILQYTQQCVSLIKRFKFITRNELFYSEYVYLFITHT